MFRIHTVLGVTILLFIFKNYLADILSLEK